MNFVCFINADKDDPQKVLDNLLITIVQDQMKSLKHIAFGISYRLEISSKPVQIWWFAGPDAVR